MHICPGKRQPSRAVSTQFKTTQGTSYRPKKRYASLIDKVIPYRPKTGHGDYTTTSRISYIPHNVIRKATPEPKRVLPGMKFRGKSSYAEQFRNSKLPGSDENQIFGPVERQHRRDQFKFEGRSSYSDNFGASADLYETPTKPGQRINKAKNLSRRIIPKNADDKPLSTHRRMYLAPNKESLNQRIQLSKKDPIRLNSAAIKYATTSRQSYVAPEVQEVIIDPRAVIRQTRAKLDFM